MILKYSHIFLFVFGTVVKAYCQNDSIDYYFLNQAVSQLPKIGDCDFILINKSCSSWIDDKRYDNNISSRLKDLKYVIDSSMLKEIINNSQKRNSDSAFLLSKAKLNKVKGLHLIPSEIADTIFKTGTKPPYCSSYKYYCSLPTFDSKKEYAVLSWGYTQHFRAEFWASYLFKRKDDEWIIIGTFDKGEY